MRIQQTTSPAFGIKVPVKTAIEAASGCFLDSPTRSNERQLNLLGQLSGLNPMELYLGEVATGLINMSRHLKEKYPQLKQAANHIRKERAKIIKTRTFKPQEEREIAAKLKKLWNLEAKKFGVKELDIEPISLQTLGLDKYL